MSDLSSLAAEIDRRLAAVARPHRAGTVDGSSSSALRVLGATVPDIRHVVRGTLRRVAGKDAAFVLALAHALRAGGTLEGRQVAYEILGQRTDARAVLGVREVEALGGGNDNWKSVDVFACEVTGPCWREGRLTDASLRRWAWSRDRWWRRTALVSTVPLNLEARGGEGDGTRTLALCALCVEDRDDMVVKACSWALRTLAARDPVAVRVFLREHRKALAPRIVREVQAKLTTGRKTP